MFTLNVEFIANFKRLCNENNIEEIEKLLDTNENDIIFIDIDELDGHTTTLFCRTDYLSGYAALTGNKDVLKLLIKKNRKFNEATILLAMANDNVDLLKFLYSHKKDLFSIETLMTACGNGYINSVRWLMEETDEDLRDLYSQQNTLYQSSGLADYIAGEDPSMAVRTVVQYLYQHHDKPYGETPYSSRAKNFLDDCSADWDGVDAAVWLIENLKITPDQITQNNIIENENIELFYWFMKNNIWKENCCENKKRERKYLKYWKDGKNLQDLMEKIQGDY